MSKFYIRTATFDVRHIHNFSLCIMMAAIFYVVLCSSAFALSGYTPVGIVLCNVVTMIWSDIGRGIATIAVMVMGIMAALGKATWGQALLLAVGISLTFGAPIIVPQLVYGKSFMSGALAGFVASCV